MRAKRQTSTKVLPKRPARNENKRPAERCRRTGANVKPKCPKSEDKTGDDESRDLDWDEDFYHQYTRYNSISSIINKNKK